MRKLERLLGMIIFCLCLYLGWQLYQPQANSPVQEQPEWNKPSEQTGQEQKEKDVKDKAEALPAVYDGRNSGRAPTVKNQGDLGTCWAVATSSALEAALLPEEPLVFSADHISLRNGYDKDQGDGGAYTMAMAYLTAWRGPVLEEEDPYGDGISPEGLAPGKHVQEIQLFRKKDLNRIKEAVYQYGAVQSSLYMDMQGSKHTSPYFNQLHSAYCYNGQEQANHDILIIGWDDHYPAGNFTAEVSGNGAFICQNSWGSSFGEGGIFYISYEDALLGTNAVAYSRIEPSDNYDKLYQSDLLGWVGQLGYRSEECYFANVYTSQEDELVKAVGFYAVGERTTYEVYGVEKFQNSMSLSGGTKGASGVLENAGYYTINLEKPFEVKAGQSFAVVVKIKTPDEEYPVATEYQADEITQSADLSDGMGYISADGYLWSNTEKEHQCNVCLKVYTDRKET